MGILCLLFLSCSNILEQERVDNAEYGSVIVSSSNMTDRALDIDSIKFANVKITGNGITPNNEPFCEVEVEDGTGTFKIEKVPVGKNRIVTVQALDSSKAVISNVTMRAIVDVELNEENTVAVNWDSTAIGNVFAKLYADGVNLREVDKSAIENTINHETLTSPFLIDTDAIANDYQNGFMKEPVNYVLQPASLSYKCNDGLGTYKIQVCDQLSSVYEGAGTSGTVENIAPGTWKVMLIEYDGDTVSKVTSKTLNFKSGKTSEVSFAQVTDKIILHAYDWTHLWAWNKTNTSENYTGGTWPGVAMTQEGETKWYTYTIEKTTSMVIFNKNDKYRQKKKRIFIHKIFKVFLRHIGYYVFHNNTLYSIFCKGNHCTFNNGIQVIISFFTHCKSHAFPDFINIK